jgi:hypothetical protein
MTKDGNITTTYQEGIKAARIAHADYYQMDISSLVDDAVTATVDAFLARVRELGCKVPMIDGEPSKDPMYFVQTVYDTFVNDEAQGYRSRDRQFAIDLLGRALKAIKRDKVT